MSAMDQARGQWPLLLLAAGVSGDVLTGKHAQCPLCSRKKSFRFDNRDGLGTWICVCGAGTGAGLLQQALGWSWKDIFEHIDKTLGVDTRKAPEVDPTAQRNLRRLHQIGQSLAPAELSVRRYLKGRGICQPRVEALRHVKLPYWHEGQSLGLFDCMVAAIKTAGGEIASFHVTYLAPEGGKAAVERPKKILPTVRPLKGGAIRLMPHGETLAISEGIENALMVHAMTQIPCWAAYSAHQLQSFEWPAEVKRLLIYGDNDESFTGQSAAMELARRAKAKGLEVQVILPPTMGVDWLEFWTQTREVQDA